MKLNRKVAALLSQPWAIRPASMAVMMESFAYLQIQTPADQPMTDEEPYDVEDGIATIRVSGIIGKKVPGWMAEMFGMTDVDTITQLVKLANVDSEVRGILLEVDSPGGTMVGVPECAEAIRASGKMVMAHTDGLMCSAGYYLASGASGIFATGSALVGSIGVFIPVTDMRRMYEMAGVEMEIIKAGDLKGAMYPGTSLTDPQRAHLQQSVNHAYGMFTDFVTARAGSNSIHHDSMRGQDFYGDQAVDAGLIDGVMDRAATVDALKKLA